MKSKTVESTRQRIAPVAVLVSMLTIALMPATAIAGDSIIV